MQIRRWLLHDQTDNTAREWKGMNGDRETSILHHRPAAAVASDQHARRMNTIYWSTREPFLSWDGDKGDLFFLFSCCWCCSWALNYHPLSLELCAGRSLIPIQPEAAAAEDEEEDLFKFIMLQLLWIISPSMHKKQRNYSKNGSWEIKCWAWH